MADFHKYFPTLISHEGGYNDVKGDTGGPTKFGITLAIWIKNGHDKDGDKDIDKYDLMQINESDAESIAKKLYWDRIKGDQIISQSVAEFVFDWGYNSGPGTAIKKLQEAVNVVADSIIGPKTIEAVNKADAKSLFNSLVTSRTKFVEDIVKNNSSQAKFLKGWKNRINSFKFKS